LNIKTCWVNATFANFQDMDYFQKTHDEVRALLYIFIELHSYATKYTIVYR
jgi:hypothetical protein